VSDLIPERVCQAETADENNPNEGTISLREAIAYANTQSGTQTIIFDPSILTKPSDNVIDLQNALPDLKGNVIIEGARLL
jgi:CSLREA domain-containing protein